MEKQVIIFLKNGESTNQEKSGAFFFDTIAGWSASAQLFK